MEVPPSGLPRGKCLRRRAAAPHACPDAARLMSRPAPAGSPAVSQLVYMLLLVVAAIPGAVPPAPLRRPVLHGGGTACAPGTARAAVAPPRWGAPRQGSQPGTSWKLSM
jgi:hypothetical protein